MFPNFLLAVFVHIGARAGLTVIGESRRCVYYRSAREVAGQCGISRFDLKRVSWVWPDQSDTCRFLGRNHEVLLLPKALAGRLQPPEWGPLIAASIILSSSAGKMIKREALTWLVLPAVLIGVILTAVALSFLKEPWTPGFLDAAGAISFAFLVFLFAPALKKRSLFVDRLAAAVVGRDNFLRVLQKIDAMGLKDVERLKGGGLRRRFKPSITERIDNLQRIMARLRSN